MVVASSAGRVLSEIESRLPEPRGCSRLGFRSRTAVSAEERYKVKQLSAVQGAGAAITEQGELLTWGVGPLGMCLWYLENT